MSMLETIGLVASILGIIQFIKSYKDEIDSWIDSLKLPSEVNFYFFAFYAIVAASLGGVFWNTFNRINDIYIFMGPSAYVGGTGSEPHGIAIIIWAITTHLPLAIILIFLNRKYRFVGFRKQIWLYTGFLVGVSIGGHLFYDLPLWGSRGFRFYFDAKNMSFFQKELGLVVIWSSLLSICGFLLMGLVKVWQNPSDDKKFFSNLLLKQVGLCIGLTTLAVVFFILAFPDQPRFEAARGIIAGLVIRSSLFFGIVLGTNPIQLGDLLIPHPNNIS